MQYILPILCHQSSGGGGGGGWNGDSDLYVPFQNFGTIGHYFRIYGQILHFKDLLGLRHDIKYSKSTLQAPPPPPLQHQTTQNVPVRIVSLPLPVLWIILKIVHSIF